MAVPDSVSGHLCELTSSVHVQLGLLTLCLGLLEKIYIQAVTFWQQKHSLMPDFSSVFLKFFFTKYPLFWQGENGGRTNESEAPPEGQASQELQQASPSLVSTVWVFFKTFFASLLPEGPGLTRNWFVTNLLVWNCSGHLREPDTDSRLGVERDGTPLAFTNQANKAARSLTSLQPRDWDARLHSKELCSIAFIRYLCRGLALWTCALKAQALSGCAKMLGKQIASSVQCDSCWNVSNAISITLSVGSQTKIARYALADF